MAPWQEIVIAMLDDARAWYCFAGIVLGTFAGIILVVLFALSTLQALIRFAIRTIRRRFAEGRI